MFLTLLRAVGTASSLLVLLVFALALFGIPLALIAFRLIEMLSEKRRELNSRSEDESTNDAASNEQVFSTNDMKNA